MLKMAYTAKKPLFTINTARTLLSFYTNHVTHKGYCRICRNYKCAGAEYELRRSDIARLLRTPINRATTLDRGAYNAVRKSSGVIRIGCKTFRLSPTHMRKVRRWALK